MYIVVFQMKISEILTKEDSSSIFELLTLIKDPFSLTQSVNGLLIFVISLFFFLF